MNSIENNFYVYVHINKNTDLPFYVGFGRKNRILDKGRRSAEWNDIVSQYGYYFGTLKHNMTREEANLFEKKCIKFFIEIGFNLVNKINGGSGNSKRKPYSEEYKKILSERGKKYWKSLSKEEIDKFSQKMSSILKGKKKPKRTKEHCKNLSISHKGQKAWNKGLILNYSDDIKSRMSDHSKKKVIIFDLNDNKIGEFDSISNAAKKIGLTPNKVSKILTGRIKKSEYKIFYLNEFGEQK